MQAWRRVHRDPRVKPGVVAAFLSNLQLILGSVHSGPRHHSCLCMLVRSQKCDLRQRADRLLRLALCAAKSVVRLLPSEPHSQSHLRLRSSVSCAPPADDEAP